jgi:hypothetical protein
VAVLHELAERILSEGTDVGRRPFGEFDLGQFSPEGAAREHLTPAKRGPKSAARNPLAAELVQARRENARLGRRLEHAEAIIEIQKNTRGPRSRLWT